MCQYFFKWSDSQDGEEKRQNIQSSCTERGIMLVSSALLFQQWLQNCKATFPRYPDDGVITCQPGDSEEKVKIAVYALKNELFHLATVYMNIHNMLNMYILCYLMGHIHYHSKVWGWKIFLYFWKKYLMLTNAAFIWSKTVKIVILWNIIAIFIFLFFIYILKCRLVLW